MKNLLLLLPVLCLCGLPAACASDAAMASAFAAAAAKLNGEGKTDKARDLCYKALANQEDCGEALYELARIFELEGSVVTAGDFFVRAARELGKREKSDSTVATRLSDSRARIRKLNPYAVRLSSVMESYAQDLSAVLSRVPDSLMHEEVGRRCQQVMLAHYVAPEKMPKVDKAAASSTKPNPSGPASASNVPLDVERALKAAGWSTITGTWVKKGTNVYEVTDGRLEAQKTDGAISFISHVTAKGTVSAFVRNSHKDPFSFETGPGSGRTSSGGSGGTSSGGSGSGSSSSSSSGFGFSSYEFATGYGVRVKGSSCGLFTPYGWGLSGTDFSPSKHHDVALPAGSARNQFLVQIVGGRLELSINGKRENLSNYKIGNEGPFALIVTGTVTIESPVAGGQ